MHTYWQHVTMDHHEHVMHTANEASFSDWLKACNETCLPGRHTVPEQRIIQSDWWLSHDTYTMCCGPLRCQHPLRCLGGLLMGEHVH